ncbi:MAG: alcohol dehydrogenase catalytic domain-containing protein [Clostridiales bacterium]
MKALKLTNQETLENIESPIPQPKNGEILIKTAYVGICRTDRKCYHMGQQDLHMPRILGHEITGTIAAMGTGVEGYGIGNQVQIHPGIGCGICPDCKSGNDQICKDMQIFGFHIDGGFAEYCLIPATGVSRGIVQKVPKKLNLETAALCEPLACAINMEERLKFQKTDSLLIIGGGVLGLLTAALAQIKGLTHIAILEKNLYKIKVAQDLGFKCYTHTISREELAKDFPQGFDIAIPCCPDNQGFTTAIDFLNKRGRFGFFSGLTSDTPINGKLLNKIHYKELALFGSYGCGLNHGKKALKILAQNPEKFKFPTNIIKLEEASAVIKNLEIENTIFTTIKF